MATAQALNSSLFVDDDFIQTKVNLFCKDLKEVGFSKKQIEKISENAIATIENELSLKILACMDDNDSKNWEEYMKTQPNTTQQFMIMNKLLQKNLGKSIEELQDEITADVIDKMLEGLKISNDITSKISKLSDEQVKQAQELIDQGNFEEAEKILNNISNTQPNGGGTNQQ